MIRRAAIQDSRAIAHIHVESWRSTYVGQVPNEYLAGLSVDAREAAWQSVFSAGRDQILVAEEGESITGFASFGPSRDNDGTPNVTGELYAIYLRPGCLRRGLGSALWHEASKVLRERGFRELVVWVLDTNLNARRFYESKSCRLDGASKTLSVAGKDLVEVRYRCELD